MKKSDKKKFIALAEIDSLRMGIGRGKVWYVPSFPDDPSSVSEFSYEDMQLRQKESEFYENNNDAIHFESAYQNTKRLLKLNDLNLNNRDHVRMLESNLNYVRGGIDEVEDIEHAFKILSDRSDELKLPKKLINSASELWPTDTIYSRLFFLFADEGLSGLQDKIQEQEIQEWNAFLAKFEGNKDALKNLLLDSNFSPKPEMQALLNRFLIKQGYASDAELSAFVESMCGSIQEFRAIQKTQEKIIQKCSNITQKLEQKHEHKLDANKRAQMWQDARNIASNLHSIGVATGNRQLARIGAVAQSGIDAALITSKITKTLSGNNLGPAEYLSAASSGIGLVLIGLQLVGMFSDPKPDPAIEMLNVLFTQIQRNHVEVMNRLNILEENQILIYTKINKILFEIKVNHIEMKAYARTRFDQTDNKLDILTSLVDNGFRTSYLNKIDVLHDNIERYSGKNTFYSSQTRESYFDKNHILFNYLTIPEKGASNLRKISYLNGYTVASLF
ncbi:MAG: hypothetical protein ACE365_00245 [Gammaproteobacteria bacterium]